MSALSTQERRRTHEGVRQQWGGGSANCVYARFMCQWGAADGCGVTVEGTAGLTSVTQRKGESQQRGEACSGQEVFVESRTDYPRLCYLLEALWRRRVGAVRGRLAPCGRTKSGQGWCPTGVGGGETLLGSSGRDEQTGAATGVRSLPWTELSRRPSSVARRGRRGAGGLHWGALAVVATFA